jgi:hypothetical protein
MLEFPGGPRKRRTRQHIIADQSVNHVERFIIDEGHTATRMPNDYGYDLLMMTFDEKGHAEPGLVFLQLKASDSLARGGKTTSTTSTSAITICGRVSACR